MIIKLQQSWLNANMCELIQMQTYADQTLLSLCLMS